MASCRAVETAINNAIESGQTALIPFFTAGYPCLDKFTSDLIAISEVGDVVEIGIPFSDPMAE